MSPMIKTVISGVLDSVSRLSPKEKRNESEKKNETNKDKIDQDKMILKEKKQEKKQEKKNETNKDNTNKDKIDQDKMVPKEKKQEKKKHDSMKELALAFNGLLQLGSRHPTTPVVNPTPQEPRITFHFVRHAQVCLYQILILLLLLIY